MSTTVGAAEKLRKEKWPLVQIVERHMARGRYTQDMLGVIDVIAYDPKRGWLAVQATNKPEFRAHREKIMESVPLKKLWLFYGFKFELWAWDKRKRTWETFSYPRLLSLGESG